MYYRWFIAVLALLLVGFQANETGKETAGLTSPEYGLTWFGADNTSQKAEPGETE